ncbi:MAG: hypothetical protein WC775_03115 [Patescibacteria group bacterium]|jgi:hypothetical protein
MTENLIHPLEQKPVNTAAKQPSQAVIIASIIALVVIFGIGSGYVLAKVVGPKGTGSSTMSAGGSSGGTSGGNSFGTKNTKLFPDSAEGILKSGGIDGEGTHHLERPGGKSQYVYLTSSSIDLTAVVGKKVKVWGKTYAAQTAGWLMDIGYLEVE